MILVTSCPDCKTTFRISVGILEKAGGQVRCGRCARIFDANAKLREVDESEVEARPAPAFKFELQPDPEADSPAVSVETADLPEADDAPEPYDAPEPDDAQPERAEASPAAAAQREGPQAAAAEPKRAATASEHIVLETLLATAEPHGTHEPALQPESLQLPDWLRADASQPPRTRLWAAGVALATLALVAQLVHHYREELVVLPAFGRVLALAYAGFGAELRPPVELDQYELRDLTAVAEPSDEDQGWLVIETRVHNSGPKVQPYPHIFVRLLDRWEDTVAARYFAPQEYAVTSIPDIDRMNVGSTIDAQFIIMDPGPSATGFELEICIESRRGFECESDVVDE